MLIFLALGAFALYVATFAVISIAFVRTIFGK